MNLDHLKESYRWIASTPLPPVFEPEDLETCRDWIVEQARSRSGVLIAGGASQWFLGNNPSRVAHVLSLRRWNGILEHVPGDLTVTVQAGCLLGELKEALSRHNQYLPFFVLDPKRSTVGGFVSTNLSGPYTPTLGGPRTHLLGVEILHSDGTLSHAGGKVVKNVAGYDLCRLYCGALGSLGILHSLTFKVLPRPIESRTLLLSFPDPEKAYQQALQARDLAEPEALELLRPGGGFMEGWRSRAPDSDDPHLLALRLLASPTVVAWKTEELRRCLSSRSTVLEADEDRRFWEDYRGDLNAQLQPCADRIVLRLSCPLTLVPRVLASARRLSAVTGWIVRPGDGTVVLFAEAADFQGEWLELADTWLERYVYGSVLKAAPEWKEELDVWGPSTQPGDLSRRLKEHFDPQGILNPGRFWGRI